MNVEGDMAELDMRSPAYTGIDPSFEFEDHFRLRRVHS